MIGDITEPGNGAYVIELLAATNGSNGVPSGDAGLDAAVVRNLLGRIPKTVRVAARSTAGSLIMTATLRLWMRLGEAGWVPAQVLNGGAAIVEVASDLLAHSEEVSSIGGADRFYLEVISLLGTGTTIKGYLVVVPQSD